VRSSVTAQPLAVPDHSQLLGCGSPMRLRHSGTVARDRLPRMSDTAAAPLRRAWRLRAAASVALVLAELVTEIGSLLCALISGTRDEWRFVLAGSHGIRQRVIVREIAVAS